MRMPLEFSRNDPFQPQLDLKRRLPRCKSSPVANTKQMRVHRYGVFTERHVEDNVGGLAPHTWQRLQRLACTRHLAAVPRNQLPRQRDDVLCVVTIKPDGLD